MENRKNNTYIKNAAYRHSNLMTASTVVCLCTLMVLMLLSTAFKSSISSLMMGRAISAAVSAFFFVSFIVLAVFAKKKDRCFWEYSIYSLVMSLGFLSMLGTPFFLPSTDFINSIFRTQYAQAGIIAVNVMYLPATLIFHTLKSSGNRK